MKEDVKISIIIPVYNAELFLRDTINSVLSQNFSDYEIIIVNDGSTDSSLNICNEFAKSDSRIQLFNQTNKGVTAARRKGIENAIGDFILFLDADDLLASGALQILYSYSSNVDVVIGFNDDPIAIPKKRPMYLNKTQLINDFLKNKLDAHPSAKLWHRSLFQHECMDAPPFIKLGEDLLMNLRLAMHIRQAVVIYKQICIYVYHEGQTTQKFKHNLKYEITFNHYLLESVNNQKKYQRGLFHFKLYELRRLTRFQHEDYNPKDPFVVETCKKALHYRLSLEDYVYIIFKNNQKICRKLLQLIAGFKRKFLHIYH
jgi:glycosyltransferase involved in cell wall biosynthesis